MNIETANYIIRHFPRLLTGNEHVALGHYVTMLKIGTPDRYNSIDAYNERVKWHKERNQITEDPYALKLLEDGIQNFYLNTAKRISEDASDKVYFNNCPKCGKLARTPYARQCKHCEFNWHDTIAAEFKVNKVFELRSRDIFFFIGNIKNGTIKHGMKIDLTFLGLAIKPPILNIEFVDHVSEKQTEVGLGTLIESDEDKEYLKKRGALAIPIIIEQ